MYVPAAAEWMLRAREIIRRFCLEEGGERERKRVEKRWIGGNDHEEGLKEGRRGFDIQW